MAASNKKETVKFEFAGQEFEVSVKATQSWSVAKAFGNPNNPASFFAAFDELFCGNADKYAEMLDDNLQDMALLADAAFGAVAGSKNS